MSAGGGNERGQFGKGIHLRLRLREMKGGTGVIGEECHSDIGQCGDIVCSVMTLVFQLDVGCHSQLC